MKGRTIKTLVADASWWLAYFYPDEQHIEVLELTDKMIANQSALWLAPPLLPFEVGNSLIVSWRRKRLTWDLTVKIYMQFRKLPINLFKPEYQEVLALAKEHDLTFYDAGYVWLAVEKKAKLLSLDQEMRNAYEALSS
jgi:predicted nucleic acid-binding protein